MTVGSLGPGSRLAVSGNAATIRWGPASLPGQGDDSWFGIEYDEDGKGKHDGTHNGVRRFQTRGSSTGSFVKLKKVVPPADFATALSLKYSDEEAPLEFEEEVASSSASRRTVDFVGRAQVVARMAEFKNFREVNLSGCNIGDAGFPVMVFPNLERLSVDENFITRWATLAAIWRGCGKLEFLSAAGNRLCKLRLVDSENAAAATVAEEDDPFTQSELAAIVEEESLADVDQAETATLPDDMAHKLPHLKHLQLEDNTLSDWAQTLRVVRGFAEMKTVNLSGNSFADVAGGREAAGLETSRTESKGDLSAETTAEARTLPEEAAGKGAEAEVSGADVNSIPTLPTTVTNFSIGSNRINEWSTVAWLARHENLRSLTVGENPIAQRGQAQALRQIVLAVLPSLTRLNAFLSLSAGGSIPDVLQAVDPQEQHRKRLEQIHGEGLVYQQKEEAAGGSAFGANLIQLTLQPAAGGLLHLPSLTKKIPNNISVAEFKTFCHNCFGKLLPLKKMRVTISNVGDPIATSLGEEDDAREVLFYMQNGAVVQIDEA
eukprot:g4577.t1